MNQRQNKLFKTLVSISTELSDMYKGAIFVLEQTQNPQRFIQASHSLRELLDKFPEKTGNATISNKLTAGSNLINYIEKNVKPELLEGVENDTEQNFIDEIIEIYKKIVFLKKEYINALSRKDEFVVGVNQMDTFGTVIPEFFNKEIEDKYKVIRQYFIDVCHQEKIKILNESDEEYFYECLHQYERLLLNIFTPKATEDIVEIEKLIKKIESYEK